MKLTGSLSFRNVKGRPARSLALMILTAIMAASIVAGTITVTSLKTGLGALEARLGADIMVVPASAASKKDLENIVLQGSMGYFYMDRSYYDKVAAREGIEKISAQLFLASASAVCCSGPLRVSGSAREAEFTVAAWIRKSAGGELGLLDVVVGNDLSVFVGDTITFYNVKCNVVAKLDKTGTDLDTAVYTNTDTIKKLIASSLELGMNDFKGIDPDKVVSCILIKVADDHPVDEVLNDLNLHVRRTKSFKTKDMISGVSDSLIGVSGIIGVLMCAVWVLGLVILFLAFTLSVNERKKEFAVLRIAGASRRKISRTVVSEALIITLTGGIAGIVAGLLIMLPFNGLIEESMGLPFLLPQAWVIAVLCAGAAVVSAAAGAVASAYSARRISRLDAGLILRGDN